MPAIGNQQQPVKRSEVMRETSDVTDAKAFPAGFTPRGHQHQRRGDPGQTRNADFGKRSGEGKSSDDRQRITREWTGPKVFQPRHIAAKGGKLQAPSSKRQKSSKFQTFTQRHFRTSMGFGAWSLVLWSFQFGLSLRK